MSNNEAEYDRIPCEGGRTGDYRFHTRLSIEQEMVRLVADTKRLYRIKDGRVTLGECRILLQDHNWNMQDLLAKQDRKSVNEMLTEAGLELRRPLVRREKNYFLRCTACGQFGAQRPVAGLICGHRACGPCWHKHLSSQFEKKKRQIQCIGCTGYVLCDERVEELIALNRFTHQFRLKFHAWRLNVYIKDRKFERCSKIGCDQFVQIVSNTQKTRRIPCWKCETNIFTHRCCLFKWHAPVPCELWHMWHQYLPVGEPTDLRCDTFQYENVPLEEKNLFRDPLFRTTYETRQKFKDPELRSQIKTQCESNLRVLKQHGINFVQDYINHARFIVVESGETLSRLKIFYFFVKYRTGNNIVIFNKYWSDFERSREALSKLLRKNWEGVKEVQRLRDWMADIETASRAVNEDHKKCMHLVQRDTAARNFDFRVRLMIPFGRLFLSLSVD